MISTGFAGVATGGGVDILAGTLLTAALIYRAVHAFRPATPTLLRRHGTWIALVILAIYPADIFWLSMEFVGPTIRLLCLFTALQLLMAREGRDYFFLGLLGFLHLLSASMYAAGLGFLLLLLLFQITAISTYAAYEVLHGAREGSKTINTEGGGKAVRLLPAFGFLLGCGILVLSAGLFAILPRVHGAGSHSLRGDYSVGFSQQVDLGLTGSLTSDPRPVMRIESLDGAPIQNLYWRGVTLQKFDGVRWTGESPQDTRTLQPRLGGYSARSIERRPKEGRFLRYRVVLEDLPTDVLFLAGEPERITGPFQALLVSGSGTTFRVPDRPRGLRYEAVSWLADRALIQPITVVELFSRDFREDYLALPEYDPRIAELAAEITQGSTSSMESARRIERYFQTNYRYALELPAERAEDPLAHFMFERKAGHCEYFASAMSVMLRTLGIPSRLVGGFAGGIENPLTGAQVIRSSDAHAWVDVYIVGFGWLEFDPSPSRPDSGDGVLSQFWMYWDALQAGWAEWVVDYDVSRQAEIAAGVRERSQTAVLELTALWEKIERTISGLLADTGRSDWSWRDALRSLPSLGPAALALALLALIFLGRPMMLRLLRRRRMQRGAGSAEDARYFFERALRALEKRGLTRQGHQTGEDIAATLAEPTLAQAFRGVLHCYNAARFGADRRAEAILPRLVRDFESLPR